MHSRTVRSCEIHQLRFMADGLRSVIRSFKYDESNQRNKVTKPAASKRSKITKSSPYDGMKDLPPSLADDLEVLFVGYNPGVESSAQQHHYAHFTNLFWKLFNDSKLFLAVLGLEVEKVKIEDELFGQLIEKKEGTYITKIKAAQDYELAKYKIGFTDLVLRCTKAASELTMTEKLQNVPRLIDEFNKTKAKRVVFIGKGIWEIVVKYLSNQTGNNVKLNKLNFKWGLQQDSEYSDYNRILQQFHKLVPGTKLYVFPNTSGLVASMKYPEKLQLWMKLVSDIDKELLNDKRTEETNSMTE